MSIVGRGPRGGFPGGFSGSVRLRNSPRPRESGSHLRLLSGSFQAVPAVTVGLASSPAAGQGAWGGGLVNKHLSIGNFLLLWNSRTPYQLGTQYGNPADPAGVSIGNWTTSRWTPSFQGPSYAGRRPADCSASVGRGGRPIQASQAGDVAAAPGRGRGPGHELATKSVVSVSFA